MEMLPSLLANEICDEIDNNCDEMSTRSDHNFMDDDGDGYGDENDREFCAIQVGYASNSTDCDDADSEINPNAIEKCDSWTTIAMVN